MLNTIEYASSYSKSRKGKSPSPDSQRNQSKINHTRQGSEAEKTAQCGGTRLEADGQASGGPEGPGHAKVLKLQLPRGAKVAFADRLKIGKEISQSLESVLPPRMTHAEIGRQLGISQQAVHRMERIALYKVRIRLEEILRGDRDFSVESPAKGLGNIPGIGSIPLMFRGGLSSLE